jgi:hypothetical protein
MTLVATVICSPTGPVENRQSVAREHQKYCFEYRRINDQLIHFLCLGWLIVALAQ